MKKGPEIMPLFTEEQKKLISQKYESAGLGAEAKKEIEVKSDSQDAFQKGDGNQAELKTESLRGDEQNVELVEVE